MDVAVTKFGTKAEVLERLHLEFKEAYILPSVYFSVEKWNKNSQSVFLEIEERGWLDLNLIVRSSSLEEDGLDVSNAGKFESRLDVKGRKEIEKAVSRVAKSFSESLELGNQILIQPMLENVRISGVIFTKDPSNNQNYLVINYDEKSQKTDTVTSGNTNDLEVYVHFKDAELLPEGYLGELIKVAKKLETYFDHDSLDIEFAIDGLGRVYIFQVRPLIINQTSIPIDLKKYLKRISHKIRDLSKEHPYLHGSKTLFGNMPDWNPAEIIGARPKPLALSLYRELVTDAIWAYQRNNYGYLNLRSFPLLVDFEGIPYVDIRLSFNSFIPKTLPKKVADKLVNYYIERLEEYPNLHDKIEFEIVYAGYSFSLMKKLKKLEDYGFSKEEVQSIFDSLNRLTQDIVISKTPLWKKDLEKVEGLIDRQKVIYENKEMCRVSKMYWLIEDCKRYGVLPFAGLARAGFIAVDILRSFIEKGYFTKIQYDNFFRSLNTVSSSMSDDFYSLGKNEFISKYGHLRPGTYDILSPCYDEEPNLYFDWSIRGKPPEHKKENFDLSLDQLRKIQDHLTADSWNINVLDFLEFVRSLIEAREYSKFIFTKSIHHFFKILSAWANELGFSKEDCSYLDLKTILSLNSQSSDPSEMLSGCIERGKEKYTIAQKINLPSLIANENDPFSFQMPKSSPNYVTQKKIQADIVAKNIEKNLDLKGKIVLIHQADPGFDWLFLKNIGGLITLYGGLNSHMAIRANELGIPAVIGCGEKLYHKWEKATTLLMDCSNKKIDIIK